MKIITTTALNFKLTCLWSRGFCWKACALLFLLLLAASGAHAQLWTPANLPAGQLKNWYDASDTNTLWQDGGATIPVTASGQTVLRWDDKSGNGNNLTSTNGPTYTNAAMNFLPVLVFADNNFYNSSPSMGSITDNFTVVGVFKATKNDSWDNWLRWGNGDQGGGDLAMLEDSGARTGGSAQSMEFHYDTGTGSYTTNNVLGQAFIFGGFVNQVGSSQFTVWENGVLQQALAPTLKTKPCTNLSFFQIGYTNVPSTRNPNGNLAEVVIVNTGTNTLADADRQAIEGYLANKWWGTGANNPLPADHPYKNGAPGASYITYNGNGSTGGAVVDADSPYPTGTLITVLGNGGLNRTGYLFTNWNTAADGSGTSYNAGASLTLSVSTTLYAQWTALAPVQGDFNYLGKLDPFYRYGRIAVDGGTLWSRLTETTNAASWDFNIPDYVLDTSFPYQKSTNLMEIPFCNGFTLVRPLSSANSTNQTAQCDLAYRDSQGNLVYQWNLLQQRLQPFMNLNTSDITFVLDSLPAAFTTNPVYNNFGQCTPPDSFVDWNNFIIATITNIVAIAGTNFASHFRFRMGTEFSNNQRFDGTIDQYNQYWDSSCAAIQSVLTNALTGPYNMTTAQNPDRVSSMTKNSYYTLATHNLQVNYPAYPISWYSWSGYIAPAYDPAFMPSCLHTNWDAFENAFPAYQNMSREVHEFDFLATAAPTNDYSGGAGAEGAGMLFQAVMNLRTYGTKRIYGSQFPEILHDRSGNTLEVYRSANWVYTVLDNLLGDDAYIFPVTTTSTNGTHYLALGAFHQGRAVLVVSAHNSDISNSIPEDIQVALPSALIPAGAGQPLQVSLTRTNSLYERIRNELANANALSSDYVANPLWVGALFTVNGNPNMLSDITNQYVITDNWAIYTNLWKSSLTLAPVPESWSLTSQTNGSSTTIGLTTGHPEIRVLVWQVQKPPVPTGLSATGSNAVVSISWSASAGATSYNVKRGTVSGGPYTTVASPTGNSYSDTGVINGTIYYYVVSAANVGGESVNSSEANAMPIAPPAMPIGLSAAGSNAVVTLSWSASTGASSYHLKRATVSGGPYTTVASPTGISCSDTGVTNGATYYYVVSAVNVGGESVNSSEASAMPIAPPATPMGLSAAGSNAVVLLSWSASAGASSYNVKRATVSGGPYTTVASPTGTSYSDTGVTNGTTYYYVVSAVNVGGESVNSSEASAMPIAPPATPMGLSAVGSNAVVLLSWSASAGASSYNVKRATVSGGPYTTVASPTAPSYSDNGIINGTTYYYVVSSVNAGGQSANSSEISARPLSSLPSPWATDDIGSVGTAGSANYSNGVFTVKGAGSGIGGTDDAFAFVYQSSSGNCTNTVRVTTLQNTGSAAKAGVIIRDTLNANAMEAGVWLTPGSGIIFTYRTSTGGSTSTKTSNNKTAPYWVKITRSGNSFSAYYSSNGTSWTQLGSTQTISMGTSAYIGMGGCSGISGTLCTSTIDNVTTVP